MLVASSRPQAEIVLEFATGERWASRAAYRWRKDGVIAPWRAGRVFASDFEQTHAGLSGSGRTSG